MVGVGHTPFFNKNNQETFCADDWWRRKESKNEKRITDFGNYRDICSSAFFLNKSKIICEFWKNGGNSIQKHLDGACLIEILYILIYNNKKIKQTQKHLRIFVIFSLLHLIKQIRNRNNKIKWDWYQKWVMHCSEWPSMICSQSRNLQARLWIFSLLCFI